jgi:hypothetical protein
MRIALIALVFLISLPANAVLVNPIMIDFGGIQGAAGAGDKGAGHIEGTISNSYFNWLHYHTATTNLTSETITKTPFSGVEIARERPSHSGVIGWADYWIGKNVVYDTVSGGELDNSATGDSVRGSQNGFASGIRFAVDPGSYIVYVTAGADIEVHDINRIFAGADTTGNSLTTFSTFQNEVLENTNSEDFLLGDNYARFIVDVGLGESLILVSDSEIATAQAVWSSIQIVDASTVPIPPAILLFGSALLGLGGIGYRRRKSSSNVAA